MGPRIGVCVAITLMGLLLVGVGANAQSARRPVRPRPPISVSPSFSVSLENDRGEPLRVFRHRGSRFVLGRLGERYSIRVSNPTDRRAEAVVSVDGRDAISGRVADFVRHRGYVVPPHGSVLIQGFRQSLQRVAAFRFSRPNGSYAARMGSPRNVGVIGVAFYWERAPHTLAVPRPPPRTRPSAPEGERSAKAPRHCDRDGCGVLRDRRSRRNLGTRYGESRFSPVVEVLFERATPRSPTQLTLLHYDDARGLRARGIEVFPDFRPPPPIRPRPQPAPVPDSRFAPPPPPRLGPGRSL